MTAMGRVGWAGLVEDFHDAQVRVVSDRPVSAADAKALVARVERAWKSDVKTQRWDDEGPLRRTLTIAVLSAPAFAQFTGDATGSIAGVTTGKDTFVMPERVLHGTTRDDENTLAHELSHVQDFREAGDAMESIPTYLEEGKATVIGDAYGRESRHLADAARTMASFTGDEVAYLLRNFRRSSDEQRPPQFVYAGEVMGALFVEYLATHVRGDAVVRLADAVEAAGRGTSFTRAFATSFGRSLGEVEREFVTFVRDTEGEPGRRLEGTLYGPR